MNATYNITNNRLFFWPDERLPKEEYEECKKAGFVWWPRGCFTAIWSPTAEDWIKAKTTIEEDDTPDNIEARVNRFEKYAQNDEQSANAANNRLMSGDAHTARQVRQAEGTAQGKTEEAEYWHRRIEGAISHAEHHDNPKTCANRIKGLVADLHRQERKQADHTAAAKAWNINPITREQALRVANFDPCDYSHKFMKSDYPVSDYEGERSIWSSLEKNVITPEQARDMSITDHFHGYTRATRWINHINMRLEYEKAYLEALGCYELIAPKPRRVSKAPDDGLKKGVVVQVTDFLGGQYRTWNAPILSIGAVSVCVAYPPGFLSPGSTWGAKGVRCNRIKVKKVE